MTALLFRLAFAGIRSRLLASALTIAIAGAASATIVLALEVRSSGLDPWHQTFEAANGAHVLAYAASEADARALAAQPGVTERGAPVPHVIVTVGPAGSTDRVFLAGLSGPTAVNRPVPTAGSPLREGGMVLERSLANALGIDVGAALAVTNVRGSIDLPVLGTAVIPSQPRYPRRNPGLAWVTPTTLERVEPDRDQWRWTQALRLANPSAAAAFTERAEAGIPGDLSFETWQVQRDYALADAQPVQVIVTMFTILLLIVAFVVVGILVGARASDQHREIGLLKAAGFTRARSAPSSRSSPPRSVSSLRASASRSGRSCAPPRRTQRRNDARFANDRGKPMAHPCRELGRPSRAPRRGPDVHPSQHPLQRPRGHPRRQLVSTEFTACARVRPILSAVDDTARPQGSARQGRRALLLAAAIALTGAVVVVALSLDATLDAQAADRVTSDIPDELPILIYTLDTVLLLITVTTLVAVALLSVRERIRDYGVLKAIGLTPRQITSTVVSAHAALALVASLLAVPFGVGLYLGWPGSPAARPRTQSSHHGSRSP